MHKSCPLFVCAFLGVLFLILTLGQYLCLNPVVSVHFISPFYFFSPWRTQKPKSSPLNLFQLHSKYQAPCLKQLLQGDHLINPGLAQRCTHHILLTLTVVLVLVQFSKTAPKNSILTEENFLKCLKKLILTLHFNTSVLLFSFHCICGIYS